MKRASKNRRLMGHMNVVPYIDVMLVLLIIFMVTAPLLQQGITVDLPEVDSETLDPSLLDDNEVLIVSIDAEGNFYVNLGADPESPVDDESVATTTAAVMRRNPETPVVVKGDQGVNFGRVAYALALLQRAGASGVGILTDPVDVEAD
jgi:biopolymer transport protein TolR